MIFSSSNSWGSSSVMRSLAPQCMIASKSIPRSRCHIRGIEGAGEQRDSYWMRRVAPFWKDIWPKTANPSPAIADDLFRLCIAAGPSFPTVLATIRSWLVPVPHPGYLLHLLLEAQLCIQFPEASLEWLDLLVDHPPGPLQDLRKCLLQISQTAPALVQDRRYQGLDQLCRQYGG
jgi:hypothetical protein